MWAIPPSLEKTIYYFPIRRYILAVRKYSKKRKTYLLHIFNKLASFQRRVFCIPKLIIEFFHIVIKDMLSFLL